MAASSGVGAAATDLPRDAGKVMAVLQSMGEEQNDPRVLHQLLEFMHRYCSEVFRDGFDYAEHSGRTGQLECEDVHLALKLKAAATQVRQPAFLEWLAKERNRQPLPAAPSSAGVQLPRPRDCLLTPNYQLRPTLPAQPQQPPEPQERDGTAPLQAPMRRNAKQIAIRLGATQAPASQDEEMGAALEAEMQQDDDMWEDADD